MIIENQNNMYSNSNHVLWGSEVVSSYHGCKRHLNIIEMKL